MSKKQNEKIIFDAFLRVKPDFASERIVSFSQPKDFPDILCITESGKQIGIELGEWLNQKEMAHGKAIERTQQSILAAVGSQGTNDCHNILCIWLYPEPKARLKAVDESGFREEIFEFIRDIDRRWPAQRYWHTGSGYRTAKADLVGYPTLYRYLQAVKFWPRQRLTGLAIGQVEIKRWPSEMDWILFPTSFEPYSPNTMLQPLLALIRDKRRHYARVGHGLDSLHLVLYYNEAVLYNSPFRALNFGMPELLNAARASIRNDEGPFEKTFLFMAVDDGEVFQLA